MTFKTAVSVAAVALALVASAGGASAAPARSAPSMAVATRQAVGGGSPQVVLVPQSAVPNSFGKFKRGDEKKYNVMIDVDIEKEEEKNPEYYGHKKGDEEEVNVKINVDVKKEKEEEEKNGVQLVSGLTAVGQAGLTAVGTPPLVPGGSQELPGQESQ